MSERVSGGKWRPKLGLVILLVLALVLCLPFAGLLLFRFYANQLVQQTEESLLMQAAVLRASYEELYRDAAGLPPLPPQPAEGREFAPLLPSVTLGPDRILPPRPDATPPGAQIGAIHAQIGPVLSRMARSAQDQTLAGYRVLDPSGTVIGGSAEIGMGLGHVPEVARALQGEAVSLPRRRVRDAPEPLIYGLSEGSRLRIFVAVPARVEGEIIGAVYLNRTPSHLFRFFYSERVNLAGAALFVLLSTGLIGWVFWRFVSRPIHGLIETTRRYAPPEIGWSEDAQYGTREIETLASSFRALADRLHDQQAALRTYSSHVSHEMKSPLTSIRGATELMLETEMTPEQRRRFLGNIGQDLTRIEDLLARMRDYSAVPQTIVAGRSTLDEALVDLEAGQGLTISVCDESGGRALPLSQQALAIVLNHLLENAAAHGAGTVRIALGADERVLWVTVQDDGAGISPGNRDRVFDPFFTTRRSAGGTGMGLNIVRSILAQSGGSITLDHSETGARFVLRFECG